MNFHYPMIILTFLLCILSGITDLYNGKVYNKVLKIVLYIGSVFIILYYLRNKNLILPFIINLLSCVFVSYLFFVFKIWGAGDSKLWIAISILFPYAMYFKNEYEIFPCFRILMLTFSAAYSYVILETVCKIVKKPNSIGRFKYSQIKADEIINFIYFYFIMFGYYQILSMMLGLFYNANQVFFAIVGILLVNKLSCLKLELKVKMVTILIVIIINYLFISVSNLNYEFNFKQQVVIFAIIAASIFIKNTAAMFNYLEIPTTDVKKGMIIAYSTVLKFERSRVNGLPNFTDETTRSRITKAESDSILRWQSSKYGEETIIIVQHLPFAVFFLIGLVLYFLIKWR